MAPYAKSSGTSVAAQSACPLEELGLDSLAVLTLRDSIESRFADIGTLDTRLPREFSCEVN